MLQTETPAKNPASKQKKSLMQTYKNKCLFLFSGLMQHVKQLFLLLVSSKMKQELRSEREIMFLFNKPGHLPVFVALSISFKFNSVKRREEKQMNIYPYYRAKTL